MPRAKTPDEDTNYDEVMKLYRGECLICGVSFGTTVHELVPKSLAPKTWKAISNRIVLCQKHHEYVHNLSMKDRDDLLLPLKEKKLRALSS